MGALPSTISAGNAGGDMSSDLLTRLQVRANRQEYNLDSHGPEDIAMFREWAEATGTDPALLTLGSDSPEANARRMLDNFWSGIAAFGIGQDMIREAELRERLNQRSRRDGYNTDIDGTEDEALARELAEVCGIALPAFTTAEAQAAAYRLLLDNMHTALQNPQAAMSSHTEFTAGALLALNNLQTAMRSMESTSNDGVLPEIREVMHSIQNSLTDIQLSVDSMNRGMADIQTMYNAVDNLNLDGLTSSFTQPDVETTAQAFRPIMNQLLSTLESVETSPEEGSLAGAFPRMIQQQTENIIQNMRTKFRDGVLLPTTVESGEVTNEMLEEAMLKELFPDKSTSRVDLYRELVSASNIRLLKHEGTDDKGRLCFLLEEVDLQDQPAFAALSYVWGDPRPPLYQQNTVSQQRKHEVVCNGQKALVSANLHNALNTIFSECGENKSPVRGIEGGRIWIDQLCINQENIPEKNRQVAFMDTIYQTAKRVVAWIGPDDSHTLEAIGVMKKLGLISRDTYTDPGYNAATELRRFSEAQWLDLSSFFASAYFQRVWIVQELAFAKEVWMLCGRFRVRFSDLVKASNYLLSTDAWAFLTVHAATFQARFNLEKQQLDKTEPLIMPMGIRTQHRIRSHVNKGKSRSEPAKILMMARELQATDLRDKFYAMIGLAKEAARRLAIDINFPLPDYNKSLEAVTAEFVHEYVHQRRNADILTMVEDASYRKLESLPSWVPDFSAPLLPRGFSDRISQKWNAGGDMVRLGIHKDGSLLVGGRCVAIVNGLAAPFNIVQASKDWSSMLELTENLFSKEPAPDMSPDEQLVRALTCNPAGRLENHVKHEFSDWMIRNISSVYQASLDTAALNATILFLIRQVDECLSLETSEARKLDFQRLSDMRTALCANAWKGMNDRAATSHSQKDTGANFHAAAEFMEALWKRNPRGLFPDPAYVREAIVSLRSRADDARPRRDEIENNARKFLVAIATNVESRVLFATNDGYLGLGAQSTRVGDEVWVISGVKVPIVLRMVKDAPSQSYTVVGQCFIPHAMLGEFLDKDIKESDPLKVVKLV